MFVYFVRPHVCLSVSVDVAFYFKLGGKCLFKIGFCLGGGVGFTLSS